METLEKIEEHIYLTLSVFRELRDSFQEEYSLLQVKKKEEISKIQKERKEILSALHCCQRHMQQEIEKIEGIDEIPQSRKYKWESVFEKIKELKKQIHQIQKKMIN